MFDSKSRMKVLGAAFDVAFLRQADPTGLTTLEQNLVNRIVDFSMRAVTHFEKRLNQSRTANTSGVSRKHPTNTPTDTPTDAQPPSPPLKKEKGSPHTPLKEKKIHPTPTTNAREAADVYVQFDAFWAAYPRKVGKHPALSKFKSIVGSKSGAFDRIMKGLAIDKKSKQWLRDNGEYIPHPSTWLNQERWEDAIANAAAADAPSISAKRINDIAERIMAR